MEIEGKIWKSKNFWLVEVPSLDAMTQGRTKAEALEMIKDLINEMLINYFPNDLSCDFIPNVTQKLAFGCVKAPGLNRSQVAPYF
jgi:predicted RNase H-like HicB family nuclease